LFKLGDLIGWDTNSVMRTFAHFLRLHVERGDRDAIADTTRQALDAASAQLGATDPGHASLSRIAGVALGATGAHDLALAALEHAWDVLHDSLVVRDELATELAVVLAACGHFSEAAELLDLAPDSDQDLRTLRRFVHRAIGRATAAEPADIEPTNIRAEAQRYLQQRLFALVQP
jgi:hypothetical protein